jgi:hypothetical protein
MRRMTEGLREQPARAVRASPMAPITWGRTARGAAVAAAIGAFLSFVGAFGTEHVPFLPRTAFMIAMSWTGTGLGVMSYRLATRLPALAGRPWLTALCSATMMFAPMGVLVWLSVRLISDHPMGLANLPGFLFTSLVMSIAMTLLALAISTRRNIAVEAPPPAPPRFLERLPLKLRGAEIWAVEAEDHYLRLHTSKGQDLILLRLADAVAELEGIDGAQVHRSWWVAREAIVDAARGDGRAVLTLRDGSQVPVSRTYARILREKRWI